VERRLAFTGATVKHSITNMCLLFALIASGCGEVAIGPHLVSPDIRLDERTVPLPFVLAFHNSGDETATIKSVSVGVIQKTLISRRHTQRVRLQGGI